MILEEQLRRMEIKLNKLLGIKDPATIVPDELMKTKYLTHHPVNSGPEYLTVHASSWEHPYTEFGQVKDLAEARELAHTKGLKGISVKFGASE